LNQSSQLVLPVASGSRRSLYRERAAARLATYKGIERGFDHDESAARRLQTLRFGMALMRASLDWADETLAADESRAAGARAPTTRARVGGRS
jgi:hypothetical protein